MFVHLSRSSNKAAMRTRTTLSPSGWVWRKISTNSPPLNSKRFNESAKKRKNAIWYGVYILRWYAYAKSVVDAWMIAR